MDRKRRYQSYLIRFQKDRDQPHWRVTVQDTQSAMQLHFATELELIYFLLGRLGSPFREEAANPPTDGSKAKPD